MHKYCLGTVGLLEDCTFRFSQWDPANPKNKYEGTPEQWDERSGYNEDRFSTTLAFSTPSVSTRRHSMVRNSISSTRTYYGKEDTLVTIQIDMLLAQRFGMEYVDVDGTKKNPYIIHRTTPRLL